MKYRVILPHSVQRQLDRLPDEQVAKILSRLGALQLEPRPTGVKKLRGRSAWRIRVGDYRVIYEIHDGERQIIVFTIGHRREVYR